jgi:ATP-dependent DNA ligase
MPTLVKIDSNDRIRVLNLWTEGATLKRTAGVLGGKLVPSEKESKPKNVGRSNETTAEQQAVLEMESEATGKLDETYVLVEDPNFLTMNTEDQIKEWILANVPNVPKAMLAKTLDLRYVDFKGGVLVSPKLDGMRCMASGTELWSRGGKPIETMTHIQNAIRELRNGTDFQAILDGELYYHDKASENFQEIISACKKYRKGVSEQVEYWVYDIVDEKMTALQRFLYYSEHIKKAGGGILRLVPQHLVYSIEEVYAYHEQFLEQGYEGTMVKNAQSYYRQDARSSDLLKLKDFQDAEYKVLDILPMENKPEFGIALMEKDGKQFKATPKMNHQERRQLLVDRDKYIGGVGTVTFFALTDEGIPRFPVLKTITCKGDLEEFRVSA